MMRRIVLILILMFLSVVGYAQLRETYVGVKGKEYTSFRATLPMTNDVPLKLDLLIAKGLFDVQDMKVRDAYVAYKKQYDNLLPATKDNVVKAGKCHHDFKLTWLSFEKGCYASVIVEARRTNSKGEKLRNRKSCLLYDLKHDKPLRMEDVFSPRTLTEINQIGGTKHQIYIEKPGYLVLQFLQDNEMKQAEFSFVQNKNAFSSSFLELIEPSLNTPDATEGTLEKEPAKDEQVKDASDTQMGYMLFSNKDYKNALPYLQKEAAQGYDKSQYALGWMYWTGTGVDKNSLHAYRWFEPSAKQGNVYAQYCLAQWYDKGKNYEKAREWCEKAAEKDLGLAYNLLGTYYHNGRGVNKDYKKAMELYLKAADKGVIYAMGNIGILYQNGLGVKRDYAQAEEWYRKALKKDPKYESIKKQLAELEELQNPQRLVEASLDKQLSSSKKVNKNLFAVIIGNEQYEEESAVPYAENDAKVMKNYCLQTLGISEEHLRYVANGGYNDLRRAVNWLRQGLESYEGEGTAIFYYAGHGIPDKSQKSAYLLPVDGDAGDVSSAYSLDELYQVLGKMPARSIIVFLDACFSGTKRDGTMMDSARGVAIKVKKESPQGNVIVFSAAQGDETAYPYESQRHGMFTYCLLQKLQESKGKVTLGELSDYVTREVKRLSFDKNKRSQTPTVNASPALGDSWKQIKLR